MPYQELDSIFVKIVEYKKSIPFEQKIGWHGIIEHLFVRKSPLIYNDLLPSIKCLCDNAEFRQYVMNIRRHTLTKNRKVYLKKISNDRKDHISITTVKHINKELSINNFYQLLEKFESEFTSSDYEMIYKNEYKFIHDSLDGFIEITSNYAFYKICSYLYENYREKTQEKEKIRNDNSFICEYFSRLVLDTAEMTSFEKYGLITLNDDFTIYKSKERCCLQYKNDPEHHYLYMNINKPVLNEFIKMLKLGLIGTIAFKIIDIQKIVPAFEDMERGHHFTLKLYRLPDISMFYDGANYENRLYVKYSECDCSLTFEELDDNFEIVDEYIRTQVVHMQFVKNDEEYRIRHLDHEYIYYTLEEYEKRKTDPAQKGKKIKTFKIDNSCIPITYKTNGIFFIYFILDNYLKHKKLLREYFNSMFEENSKNI